MKFDHIGVAVSDMAEGRTLLQDMFGVHAWTEVIEDSGIGVYVQFGIGHDGPCYELISPRGEDSPISVALRPGKSVILNHVAYLVPDLAAAANTLCEAGSFPVGRPQPAVAYNNRLVQFFQTPLRFVVELIEAPDHHHAYRRVAANEL